jgi:hypothetical protein
VGARLIGCIERYIDDCGGTILECCHGLFQGGTNVKIHRLLVVLTLLNFGLLLFQLFDGRRAAADTGSVAPVLRARGLQIVDEEGRVRASLTVLPAATQKHGEKSAETVLLRLITERGRPSVKIDASEEAAGLAFAGPTGTKSTWLTLRAEGTKTSLTLRNEDGREQFIKP